MGHVRPTKIHLHRLAKTLELVFAGTAYSLSAEFLRVHSTSAEVKGHGPGQETLVDGKINVGIDHLRAVGHYGLQIVFSDGHDSGIYSWSYLKKLCEDQDTLWQAYLEKLRLAKKSRDPHTRAIRLL